MDPRGVKTRIVELRVFEGNPFHTGAVQLRVGQVGRAEVGLCQVSVRKVSSLQTSILEVRLCEKGTMCVSVTEIPTAELCALDLIQLFVFLASPVGWLDGDIRMGQAC